MYTWHIGALYMSCTGPCRGHVYMTYTWPVHDIYNTCIQYTRPVHDHIQHQYSIGHDLNMYLVHDLYNTYTVYMTYTWPIHDLYMTYTGHLYSIHDIYMTCTWHIQHIYSIHVYCTWPIHDIYNTYTVYTTCTWHIQHQYSIHDLKVLFTCHAQVMYRSCIHDI